MTSTSSLHECINLISHKGSFRRCNFGDRPEKGGGRWLVNPLPRRLIIIADRAEEVVRES